LYPRVMANLPDHLKGVRAGQGRVPREVLSEHQRERVLIAVTAVFAKRGYHGTTVDDLLVTGKVGVGNFYSLFEGKEDCFLAAYDRILTNARQRIDEVAAAGSDWSGQTYLGLRALLGLMLGAPLEARLALIEAQSAGSEAMDRYNAVMDEAIEWLHAGRRAHPAASELPPSFEQASASGLAFYLQQCLLDSRRHSLEELLEETAGLILEPIVGRRELERVSRAHAAISAS
jgi:AcrR family transcriptional regulator